MVTAENLMIHEVVFVEPNATIRDVLLHFSDSKVSGMPVLDSQRRLVGMITVGDIVRQMQPHFSHTVDLMTFVTFYVEQATLPDMIKELILQPVSSIMTKRHLAVVSAQTEIERVLALFAEKRFKKLPVIGDKEQVVGVISRGDVVRYLVQEMLQV